MTGLLDRVLSFGGTPRGKPRQSTAGTPRGGGLAEALRARGGAQNLQTVISHRNAASDTEAFTPAARRPVRQSMPSSLPSASSSSSASSAAPESKRPLPEIPKMRSKGGASSSDDSELSENSHESNLGWLDLQAFAPKSLQQQLEKLMDTVNSDDKNVGIAAVRSSAKAALAGLQESSNDFFRSGTAGEIVTPRLSRPSSVYKNAGLRAALQNRGGIGEHALHSLSPEGGERDAEPAAALCDPVALPTAEAALENRAAVPTLKLSLSSVPEDREVATAEVSSDTSSNTSSDEEPEESLRLMESSQQDAIEAGCADNVELRTTPVEEHATASASEVPRDDCACELGGESSQAQAQSAPVEPAAAEIASSASSAASVNTATKRPKTSLEKPSTSLIVSAGETEKNKPLQKAPVAQWCPAPASTIPQWPPKDTQSEQHEDDEARPSGTASKFKDARDFWGKHSVRFAGPSLGSNSISKNEAQAALQRLMSNGAACDPSEVRRLNKLIDV